MPFDLLDGRRLPFECVDHGAIAELRVEALDGFAVGCAAEHREPPGLTAPGQRRCVEGELIQARDGHDESPEHPGMRAPPVLVVRSHRLRHRQRRGRKEPRVIHETVEQHLNRRIGHYIRVLTSRCVPSHACTSFHQSCAFCGFRIQCPSSG